jgi:hypothetical protein
VAKPPSLAAPARVQALLDQHAALLRRDDWLPAPAPDSVQAWTLQTSAPIAYVRCATTLGLAAAELARYLIDDMLATLGEWNPIYTDGRVLHATERARLLHLSFRSPAPLIAPRDNLIAVTRVDQPDGTAIELSEDDQHADHPPARGVVRMILPFASKQITPLGPDTCTYTVIWQTDPGGMLGRLLPRPLLVRAVLNDLIGEVVRLRRM